LGPQGCARARCFLFVIPGGMQEVNAGPNFAMLVATWLVWCGLVALAIVAIEELLVDLGRSYLKRVGRGANRLRAPVPVIGPDDLPRKSRKSLGILVPAWIDDDVLFEAVTSLASSIDDHRSQIFIASMHNDPRTRDEAEMLASRYVNVHSVVLPIDGPEPTATAINGLLDFALDYETQTSIEFHGFLVVHPGDSLHPRSLDLVQWALDRADVVRLPVLAATSVNAEGFIQGHFGDALAEHHLRTLPVRAGLSGLVSSGGSLLAFSRNAARDARSATHSGELLSQRSFAPDYEFALRLADTNLNRVYGRMAISARRRFPTETSSAVRYRARRVAGLTRHALPALFRSMQRSFWHRLALWQDARTIPLAHIIFLGVCAALSIGMVALMSTGTLAGGWDQLRLTTPALAFIASVALFGLVSRLVHRHVASVAVYGPSRLFMVLPRFLFGLVFEYMVVCRATLSLLPRGLRFIAAAGDTRQISIHSLRRNAGREDSIRSPLGEMLVARNELNFKSLSVALKTQRLIRRPLGRILIDTGEAEEDTILRALSEQLHLEVVDFDAAELPARIGLLLPTQFMHEHRMFPVAVSDAGEVVVASYRQLDEKSIRTICDHVSMPVKICLARRGEVRRALRMFRSLCEVVDTRFLSASDESLGELAARLRRGTRKRLAARKPTR